MDEHVREMVAKLHDEANAVYPSKPTDIQRGPQQPAVEPIPKSIVEAICKVQGSIQSAISKVGKNPHGGYKFLAIDDVLATITNRLADAQLAIIPLQTELETERFQSNGKTAIFATITYQFILATPEASWTDTHNVRTVRAQLTGPQAFGAIQSYCEKMYYRSLFKIPSGDVELDVVAQAPTVEEQAGIEASPAPAPKKRKSSAAAKRDGQDAEYSRLMATIQKCRDPQELEKIRLAEVKQNKPWGDYPIQWALLLEDNFNMRLNDLNNAGA